MDQASAFVQATFGSKDLYKILGVEKTATEDDIKRAYRKLALLHHPDRSGGDTEKFKALSIVHSILSDSTKRSLYDTTGDVDTEDAGDDFKDWYDYFRNLFPKLTVEKIEEFKATYKGSQEEREDLIEAYLRFNGKMEKVMEVVILAEEGEEERLCSTIDSIISFGDLEITPNYEKFKTKTLKYAAKPKKNKRKTAKKQERSESDLAALILSNRSSRGAGFGNIVAKYGGKTKEEFTDISDEAFAESQKRIFGDSKEKKMKKT